MGLQLKKYITTTVDITHTAITIDIMRIEFIVTVIGIIIEIEQGRDDGRRWRGSRPCSTAAARKVPLRSRAGGHARSRHQPLLSARFAGGAEDAGDNKSAAPAQ